MKLTAEEIVANYNEKRTLKAVNAELATLEKAAAAILADFMKGLRG